MFPAYKELYVTFNIAYLSLRGKEKGRERGKGKETGIIS